MELSDFISLLAFILSVYGAVISTMLALETRLKLKIRYLDLSYLTLSRNHVIINEYGVEYCGYSKDFYTLAILVRITNKSSAPTTINEFVLNNTYKFNSSFNMSDSLIPSSFRPKNNTLVLSGGSSIERNLLKPLLELKPLSTVEGFIVFTNIAEIPKNFKIKIETVQKSKTFKLKFDISNDYRNEIRD